jgi:uncharacterized membrane protein YeaQ/YmgE (transglycosylase-associated protein family)
MGIVIWIVAGLVLGALARAVMPGPDPLGRVGAIALGIGGAVLGGALGTVAGDSVMTFDFRSVLMAVIGSLFALLCYRSWAMRAAY